MNAPFDPHFRSSVAASLGETPGGEAAGLVSVSTTQKVLGEPLLLCKDEVRFIRLQKNIGIAAKLHLMELQGRRFRPVMVTPTYRPGVGWHPSHMGAYVDHVRKWFSRHTGELLRYVWVAESQDGTHTLDGIGRDMVHYHCIFFLPTGLRMPKADTQGWWPYGMTNTLLCTSPVGYVMSYAKKLASKAGIPSGARLYGVGGLSKAARLIRRWINFPSFVQARADVRDEFRRQPGGGWTNCATGERWPSEYGLALVTRRHSVVVRLHDHGRPLADVVGPFTWLGGP